MGRFFVVPFGQTLMGRLNEIGRTHSGCIPRMGRTIIATRDGRGRGTIGIFSCGRSVLLHIQPKVFSLGIQQFDSIGHDLPDIPARRKDEVNVPHRIIRLSIKVILIRGADIRPPALPRVNIDIQVPVRPFVDGAAPTVPALED